MLDLYTRLGGQGCAQLLQGLPSTQEAMVSIPGTA